MADISQVLLKETIIYQGTEYAVEAPTFETRAAYVHQLEANAIAFVRRHKADYKDDYFWQLNQVTARGAAKVYAWGGLIWAESLNSNNECPQELALLVLRQGNPRINRTTVAEMFEAEGGKVIDDETKEEKPATLGAELFQKIMGLVNRPNLPRPAVPGEP